MGTGVTTCVVVWIEIRILDGITSYRQVTTCVVVWIEIFDRYLPMTVAYGHHLRGGVD